MPTSSKVFGIGLSKTGTTSLANALQSLGYRTKDNMGVVRYAAGDLSSIDVDVVDAHEALTDTPIPSFYRELDARYPHSKFILTVRERYGWMRSCRKQFNQRHAQMQNDAHRRLFIDLYGTDVFDEARFVAGYERFVGSVFEYFEQRPADFLVMDIAAGDGWNKLCTFLGKPVPQLPFPKANVTELTWINVRDLVAIAKDAGAQLRTVVKRGRRDGMLGRALVSLAGGYPAALQRARKKAHRTILTRLQSLTPKVPVVSPLSNDISFGERSSWNHLWLVDPLHECSGGEQNFTINIALVEDGRPIYGVVYAPVSDTLYYAKAGHGSYKVEGEHAPRKLERARTQGGNRGQAEDIASHALAMCRVAEGDAAAYSAPGSLMEWETAAAHAIARFADRAVFDARSREELRYNKRELVHGSFTVR